VRLLNAVILACWFTSPVRYISSADEVVLLADLDGDAAPEILTSGNHVDEQGAFSLFPNLGDGAFGSERHVQSSFGERLEAVADLNGDGTPDLLASNYWQDGIAIHRGLGLSQFAAGTAYDTATHGGPSRAVDYDRDGLTDIVSFSFGSGNPVRVHLFRGRADGTFDPKTTIETSLAIAASPSARIRDGALEILAGEHSGRLGLFRFAAGGISLTTLDAGPGFDLSSIFADVDGDGISDVVDTNDGGSEADQNPYEWVFVTLARSDGGFLDRKQVMQPRRMTLPTKLRAADIDGDGHVDLIVSDFRETHLHYLRGHGTGSFDEAVAIDAAGPVNDFAVGDVNGDRRPDLVTVNDDHSVSVIMNGGRCGPPRRRAVRH